MVTEFDSTFILLTKRPERMKKAFEYLNFDISACRNNIKKVNSKLDIYEVSAKTGENLNLFIDWVKNCIYKKKERK